MAHKVVTGKKNSKRKITNILIFSLVLLVLGGIPYAVLHHQAGINGSTPMEVLKWLVSRQTSNDSLSSGQPSDVTYGEKSGFLSPVPIGQVFTEPPMISNLAVADLDGDGRQDVIVCDARNNFISWIRQNQSGTFEEIILADSVLAPAHAQVTDFDKDGDKDIIVAGLGLIFPSNDKIGSVLILENKGDCSFIRHTIVENIARVSDVRAGDLDNDGDIDLAAGQFGYDDGETRWLENLGDWNFRSHILQTLSGPVNTEILDIDKDNDLDIISLVSQEWEQIYCFVNDGAGRFQTRLLWGSDNEDFGSSGIFIYDYNRDGLDDILYTNGDAFDYIPPRGKPWHGIQWLENRGDLNFRFHRICTFIGAYSARPADIDNDGDVDLFSVSGFNLWDDPDAQSFLWVENIDNKKSVIHNIANDPTHLITLEAGDFNNDGLTDFVTGGMHAYGPYDRMGRVTLWIQDPVEKE